MSNQNNKSPNILQAILGIGAVALLLDALFGKDDYQKKSKKRVFISFSKKDEKYRDYLVKQAKSERSPFEFMDMSVKQPWQESVWKQKCRSKIKSCDGMIVLLSRNTYHSKGARWEIKCAREEGVPLIGMHVKKDDVGSVPPELRGKKIITWSWDNLDSAINRF